MEWAEAGRHLRGRAVGEPGAIAPDLEGVPQATSLEEVLLSPQWRLHLRKRAKLRVCEQSQATSVETQAASLEELTTSLEELVASLKEWRWAERGRAAGRGLAGQERRSRGQAAARRASDLRKLCAHALPHTHVGARFAQLVDTRGHE